MKCQKCGTEVQEPAKFCPICGSKMEQPPVVKAPAASNFPHDIGHVWPEWQIEKQLGRGSYGVVYQAVRRDNNVESHAAIKIISIPSDSSEIDSLRSEGLDLDGTRTYFKEIVDDFVGEIQLMESLKGIQNIVSVEDYKVIEKTDAIGWDIYIRMELLTPFNNYICDKTLTEAEVIKIGTDICTALELCSQRRIIHRDIKPENIFVNDFGHFKLGDFGIARKLENMTGGLSQKGTYNYMAPEVANSTEYDARVDTYSLGIVLYRLLNNNKLPFLDTDKQLLNPNERKQAVERRIHGEALPAPCSASPAMANLILRACAYDPNARFASAADMKQALMSVANGTYAVVDSDLDKTTSVRTPESNDRTTTVRKAPETTDQGEPEVGTFGDAPKTKMSAGKKVKIILLTVLSLIVVLAIAGAVLFFTGTPYAIYQDIQDQQYARATNDYHKQVEGSFIDELILDMLLAKETSKATDNYNSGEWDYHTTVAHLDALAQMGFEDASAKSGEITEAYATAIVDAFNSGERTYDDAKNELNALVNTGYGNAGDKLYSIKDTYATDTVNKFKNGELSLNAATTVLNALKADGYDKAAELIVEITSIENANTALDKGNEYYENGDYEEAITELSKIPEGNENYEEAQQKLNQAYAAYVDSTVSAIERYNSQRKYKEAVQYANIAYGVLPDSVDTSAIDAAKEEALTAYKTDVASEVTELINESNYVDAFDVIDDAIAFDDNDYFRDLRVSTEGKYTESVAAIVQGHLDNEDYINAKRVVDNSLTVLPENSDLKSLQSKVEKATPTYLLDVCKPYESNGFTEFINGETIAMGGKTYTNGFTLGGDHYSDEYAIFNVDSQYSSLNFLIGHIDGAHMHDATIKFYCDGVLKKDITIKSDSLPQKISMDITGVNQVKIVVSGLNRYSSYGFANATIK